MDTRKFIKMPRYCFISHLKGFMKELLNNPLHAKIDGYLLSHGITTKDAIDMLLKKASADDPYSAIMIRTEKIRPAELSEEDIENGVTPKDNFHIKYNIPKKDFSKKLRNLYISLFESNIIEGCPIEESIEMNEEGEGGGATTADASGQYSMPLFGGPIRRKTLYITQEQADELKKLNEDSPAAMSTLAGDIGYDAPGLKKKKDPAYNHKGIFKGGRKK